MTNQKGSREVLLDNYTLQASYGYFQNNKRGLLYTESLSNLIESIVIYDKIFVPADVLNLNSACREIADRFRGIKQGRKMDLTPDLHHHSINMKIVNEFRDLLSKKHPFAPFENQEAYDIELIGRPDYWSPVYMGRHRDDLPLSFSDRHIYYAWYCVKLSAELGMNYVPNPTRVNLFQNTEFMRVRPFADFGKSLLEYFKPLKKNYADRINDILKSHQVTLDLPLIFSYIKSKGDYENMIAATLELRDSVPARGYREYCLELENALRRGDSNFVDSQIQEIKKLADQWSQSLTKKKAKKRFSFGFSFMGPNSPSVNTDHEVSFPNPFASDRKPYFVFLHKLISNI
jgi:hypothetical protein